MDAATPSIFTKFPGASQLMIPPRWPKRRGVWGRREDKRGEAFSSCSSGHKCICVPSSGKEKSVHPFPPPAAPTPGRHGLTKVPAPWRGKEKPHQRAAASSFRGTEVEPSVVSKRGKGGLGQPVFPPCGLAAGFVQASEGNQRSQGNMRG